MFDIFGAAFPPLWRMRWNFAQPSGPKCPSALPNLTWIGATSRFYTPNYPTSVFQISCDSHHRLRSYCGEIARR